MNIPRWLTYAFSTKLSEIDARLQRDRYSGALVIEIHYHEGVSRISKLRDWILPPAILEIRLASTSS